LVLISLTLHCVHNSLNLFNKSSRDKLTFNKSSRDKRKSFIRASASKIDYSRVDFGIFLLVSNVDLHYLFFVVTCPKYEILF
jgi:hypothetical protein